LKTVKGVKATLCEVIGMRQDIPALIKSENISRFETDMQDLQLVPVDTYSLYIKTRGTPVTLEIKDECFELFKL